jgi:hypothetical protein
LSPPAPKTSPSAALNWPPIARFIDREARVATWAERTGPLTLGVYEFIRFGVKQGWACLFGAAMLALIVATHLWYPPHRRNRPSRRLALQLKAKPTRHVL